MSSLYPQVKERIARPMGRLFGDPRGIRKVTPGRSFHIVPPPSPLDDQGTLSFVTARLQLPPAILGRLSSFPWVGPAMHRALSIAAIMTGGYMYRYDFELGCYWLAFDDALHALRFCMVSQCYLMLCDSLHDPHELLGATEKTPDGRLLFRGPRVAMAMHQTNDYRCLCRALVQRARAAYLCSVLVCVCTAGAKQHARH